jgi:hypothetical protein
MNADIWVACAAGTVLTNIEGMLYRFVAIQVELATNRLVSSLDEQAVLENLLEQAKPPIPTVSRGLHYLLATPFRYPPLRHGSRFGQRHEPSLFYGSLTIKTVLAESAYYRLVFWHGMKVPPHNSLDTQHILFKAYYDCEKGIKLHQQPFNAWHDDLTNRCSYAVTQALGSAMRKAGVEAFEFTSARDPKAGLNVALFTTSALASCSPEMTQNWLVETYGNHVTLYCHEDSSIHDFDIATFLVNGILPMPAM